MFNIRTSHVERLRMARQSLYEYKRDGIISAVRTLTEAHGRAPSIREIAEVADVSVATLHSYLLKMRNEGVLTWTEKHHRSLKLKAPGRGRRGTAEAQ